MNPYLVINMTELPIAPIERIIKNAWKQVI
jgi:histone H3/H4